MSALVGVALLGLGFGIGRATTHDGPTSLAEAVQQASDGILPCGPGLAGSGLISRLCNGGASTGGGGAPIGLVGPGTVTGTVTSKTTAVDGSTLTVSTRAGTVTVQVPSTVKVDKSAPGTLKDIPAGATVAVTATTAPNGTRTASRILVLPKTVTPG